MSILLEKRFLDKDSLITEFEKQLFLYNLDSTKSIFEETFGINGYNSPDNNGLDFKEAIRKFFHHEIKENDFPNCKLKKIAKNLKSNNIEDIEKGYEKFIGEYLNIKIFRLFGEKIALYSKKKLKNSKNSSLEGAALYSIKREFAQINDYIHIFDIENKHKNGIGVRTSSFVIRIFWSIFFPLIPIFVEISEILPVIIIVSACLIGVALDWINIANEKDFKWSRRHGVSTSLFVIITIVSPMIISAINTVSTMYILQCILLIIGCLLVNIILFVKMVMTSQLRYERLKEFSKKVLDVFIFNK